MNDIEVWLETLGLVQYSRAFLDRGINLDELGSLTEIDLEEIGIPSDHRKRILAIYQAQQTSPPLVAPKEEPERRIDQGAQLRAAERRLLTILFVDIVDSTLLARRLDPEDLARLLNSFHDICGCIVKRLGGCVAKDLGDGLGAYFGWPESHEQDAERAVMAALEIIESVKAISNPAKTAIQVHVGIATGEVVVADVIRRTSTLTHEVFGELPSLASRLQTSSPPDAILVSSETHRLIRHKFVCVEAGRKRLKGFHALVQLHRVIGPRTLPLNFDVRRAAGLTPLIGRRSELEFIRGLWEDAKTGNGKVALLTGDPGIGKSRLCDEAHSSLAQHDSLQFQCSAFHKDVPLYPVIRSIARLAELSDHDAPHEIMRKLAHLFTTYGTQESEVIRLLGTHLGASKESGAAQELPIAATLKRRRTMLNEFIIKFFITLSKDNPILIVFEDLHWMDPTTAEFLDLLIDQVPRHSILVICTSRSDLSSSWPNAEQIALDRLTKSEAAQFIRTYASETWLTDDLVLKLVERSDGNPLYIEELTAAVLRSRPSTGPTLSLEHLDSSGSTIPSSLQESLLARIDRASAEAKELIQVCAVVGRRFSYGQLLAIAGIEEQKLNKSLDELLQERLLHLVGKTADVEYSFKHALIQATAYSTILRQKRIQLHLKCAQTLESQFPSICQQEPEVIGLHYQNANHAQAAVPYILIAARSAIDRSALQEATVYLHRGLRLLESLPPSRERDIQELSFRSALGRVSIFSKGWADQSVKVQYERALYLAKQVGNKKDEVPLEWALTTYFLLRGEIHKSIDGGRRVLGLAELSADDNLQHVAHSALSIYEFYGGNFIDAIAHKDQALRHHRQDASEALRKAFGTDRRLQALRGAALAYWCVGDHQLAVKLDDEQRLSAIDHPFDYTYALTISCILYSLGRNADTMRKFSENAIAIAQEQGFGFLESNAANFRAIALSIEAPTEEKLRLTQDVFGEYRQAGNRMGTSSMLGILAELYGKIDLPGQGLGFVERALNYAKRSGEKFAYSDLFRIKGVLLASLQRREEAKKCFLRALQIAKAQQAKTWELSAAISMARLLCDEGNFERTQTLLKPLCDDFADSKFVEAHLIQAKALLKESQYAKPDTL